MEYLKVMQLVREDSTAKRRDAYINRLLRKKRLSLSLCNQMVQYCQTHASNCLALKQAHETARLMLPIFHNISQGLAEWLLDIDTSHIQDLYDFKSTIGHYLNNIDFGGKPHVQSLFYKASVFLGASRPLDTAEQPGRSIKSTSQDKQAELDLQPEIQLLYQFAKYQSTCPNKLVQLVHHILKHPQKLANKVAWHLFAVLPFHLVIEEAITGQQASQIVRQMLYKPQMRSLLIDAGIFNFLSAWIADAEPTQLDSLLRVDLACRIIILTTEYGFTSYMSFDIVHLLLKQSQKRFKRNVQATVLSAFLCVANIDLLATLARLQQIGCRKWADAVLSGLSATNTSLVSQAIQIVNHLIQEQQNLFFGHLVELGLELALEDLLGSSIASISLMAQSIIDSLNNRRNLML